MKICHLINDLDAGGAEFTLLNLLRSSPAAQTPHVVVSLLDGGALLPEFRKTGHRLLAAGMQRSLDPSGCFRLFGLLRREKPDVLHCWMYHSNLLGMTIGRAAGVRRVIFSLHHAVLDPRIDRKTTVMAARLGARLSGGAAAVVSCADTTRRLHLAMGYRADNMITIYNGIDTERFNPAQRATTDFRRELQIGEDELLIGMVGRYHPVKNHRGFLAAAARILREAPLRVREKVRFILAGLGTGEDNRELASQLAALGLRDKVKMLGYRSDIHCLLPHFDLLVSASDSEAFPLNIGEAMASGVPCVVTDVGDSALLVGDTGLAVEAGNAEKLAAACLELLTDDRRRKALGLSARQRVEERFSLCRMAGEYQSLYNRVLEGR